jgi:hypothetical protein
MHGTGAPARSIPPSAIDPASASIGTGGGAAGGADNPAGVGGNAAVVASGEVLVGGGDSMRAEEDIGKFTDRSSSRAKSKLQLHDQRHEGFPEKHIAPPSARFSGLARM